MEDWSSDSEIFVDSDDYFVNTHLKQCPKKIADEIFTTTGGTPQGLLQRLAGATTKDERCSLVCALLSYMSKIVWACIKDNRDKMARLDLGQYDSPIQFIDHHLSPPTHYPFTVNVHIPNVVGVFPPQGNPKYEWSVAPSSDPDVRVGVPHYRLETLVEIKDFIDPGTFQGNHCVTQYLRARPDRPGVYCLSVGWEGFNIVYADTSDFYESTEYSFRAENLQVLASYVYSIYDPPAQHILRDPSIRWEPSIPLDPTSEPCWILSIGGQEYSGGKTIFGGNPWSGRTTISAFNSVCDGSEVIMKDTYRQVNFQSPFDEGDLINRIHADGWVPGVVRLLSQEYLLDGGERVIFGKGTDACIRRRFLLADRGSMLTEAKSVNDLLKAVYDALEVHRTIALERKVLHRDMTLNNILMYPKWGKMQDCRVMDNRPPLINDVLIGGLRDVNDYQADCMLIDFDCGAELDSDKSAEELKTRVGTSMYISRAACAGRVWSTMDVGYLPMPELSSEARKLYDKAHGAERYSMYQDEGQTVHGGVPPPKRNHTTLLPDFYHKLEYDAESIFWSMLVAFLQVRPCHVTEDPSTSKAFLRMWQKLDKHTILVTARDITTDGREAAFLNAGAKEYLALFYPCMQDVALMMHELSQQVAPCYAVMEPPPPHPEHLHEAMQRIILNYLVAHRDKDVILDPSNLRCTNE